MPYERAYMDTFNDFVRSSDEIEAHEINRHYDDLSARQYGGNVLRRAIDKAHRSLESGQPYAEEFGYEVAGDAIRWLNFRTAHTHDAIDSDLRKGRTTFGQMLDDHQEEDGLAYQRINERDSLSFGAYAQLEHIRSARERTGQAIGSPLELEEVYAQMLVANTLDGMLEDPSTIHDAGESTHTVSITIGESSDPLDCVINRQRQDAETKYAIRVFKHPEDEFDIFDDQGVRPLVAAYNLTETSESINLDTYAPIELVNLNTFNLVRILSPDENYVFKRQSSYIPELVDRAGA